MVEKKQTKKPSKGQNLPKPRQNNKSKKKQADDKSARVKKAQKLRKLFTWTILIGIVIGIFVFLCKAKMFNICNIEITGNLQIPTETILQVSGIDTNDNIFLARTIKAKNKIKENPYVKEIIIKRELPDKIKIEVIEKQKAYMLQLETGYVYVDKYGEILEISENRLENLITLYGYTTKNTDIIPGNKLNKEDLEKLEDVQKILKSGEKNQLNDKIASIDISDGNNYILNLAAYKKNVYIGNTSNLSTKMLRAKDIIDKTTDLEGKIFVNGEFGEGFDPYFREEANS